MMPVLCLGGFAVFYLGFVLLHATPDGGRLEAVLVTATLLGALVGIATFLGMIATVVF